MSPHPITFTEARSAGLWLALAILLAGLLAWECGCSGAQQASLTIKHDEKGWAFDVGVNLGWMRATADLGGVCLVLPVEVCWKIGGET